MWSKYLCKYSACSLPTLLWLYSFNVYNQKAIEHFIFVLWVKKMAQKALSKAVFEEYHLLPSGNKCLRAFLSLDWILTIYWTLLYI